ncbi:Iron-sulfur cluster-binding protein [Rhodovulum sp. P5]|uniref:4Fe-4S binding protein n=1 Tax=Rhodovulum sp. P5 TaxID=1564506 RepID=UPI0009C3710F|nr:4Fe-4S binding protein [Rhodovulum sp. P5]ARE41855.1 Iron-sulfur cluster-binding protein [Rhodovulum sp. P5]
MGVKLLLCDCAGTQVLGREAIARACGLDCSAIHSELCGAEADRLASALSAPGAEVIVACAQEAETFAELAEDLGAAPPLSVDIRDRAGWSDEAGQATPKIAALLAAAQRHRPPVKTVDVLSDGVCLVLGPPGVALPAAEQLADVLSVTCLLTETTEIVPAPVRRFDIAVGRLRKASGVFGRFAVTVDAMRAGAPSGRGAVSFGEARDGGVADCDIILDLSGNPPLFPAHEKRDGYLRADPGDPLTVQRVVFDASHLVGVFEKTLHVALDGSLCAHARAGKTGCTRCLDACPTGAILPDGDSVAVDPLICAGCGACSSLCPSGAIAYDAPPVTATFDHILTLAGAYRAAGGVAPRLLVHDDTHGREMIALAARFGRGLPADVIPLALPSLGAFGHAEMMAALATGFVAVDLLLSPRADRETLTQETALANAMTAGLGAGAGRVALLDVTDPDALSDALYGAQPHPLPVDPILPLGQRREVTRLAARALAQQAAPVALPAGAPYGAVVLDAEACTLCLSCAGLCPPGALLDNPDKPQLRFREEACLQCGLCVAVCPEDAIRLQPRLDISDAALSPRVLKEEEPYHCIECGKPFGVKSTVERIVAKLEGSHAMFTNSDNTRLIRMCDDCRVNAQYHAQAAPFRMGDRPKVRTTDDYLEERKKT